MWGCLDAEAYTAKYLSEGQADAILSVLSITLKMKAAGSSET